jgi:cation:H+ antiporter
MSLEIALMIIGGLIALVVGGDLLVRGASAIALRAGVSTLVIGLTVVAYGTSMPELVVSLKAGLEGNPNIAVANVVGSNIFNVLMILGLCALILPLAVSRQLVKVDVPVMIGGSLAMAIMAYDGRIAWYEGVLLCIAVMGYTYSIVSSSRKLEAKKKREAQEAARHAADTEADAAALKVPPSLALNLFFIIGGLTVLVIGANYLIEGSVQLAKNFGVSDTVIGLTIVAVGTSLPEVAASVIATWKGERDIAIGNVIGSNIYNIFMILGIASVATPGGLAVAPEMIVFDIPVMVAVAVICLPVFLSKLDISRLEGGLFFGGYVAYTTYLVLAATQSPALGSYTNLLLLTAAPAGLAIVAWSTIQCFRSPSGRASVKTS